MIFFFLVLAKDDRYLSSKIDELCSFGFPYSVVCGKKIDLPGVVYRRPIGKYDAINYGVSLIPEDVDVVILNDVDTKIFNIEAAMAEFSNENVDLVFAKVEVKQGPQQAFYQLLDSIRRKLPIAASGELMLIRREALLSAAPMKPCKAEDSYLLFRALSQKRSVIFSEKCYVLTERTKRAEMEELYKKKTVTGIYQALKYASPSFKIRFFYALLPFLSPFLMLFGTKGYYWSKGILLGFLGYLRGDAEGSWKTDYMENQD